MRALKPCGTRAAYIRHCARRMIVRGFPAVTP